MTRRERLRAAHSLDFFVYPRLLAGRAPVGYDFGYFLDGMYVVVGNARTRELAEGCIRQGFDPASIAHEAEPSASKHRRRKGGA